MSENFDLKPCPFCGSRDLELSNTHTPCFWVECSNCEAQVSGDYFREGPGEDSVPIRFTPTGARC